MNASVSVDGFIAPIFEWPVSGDVPLDDSGVLKASQASFDYVRPYWDEVGAGANGENQVRVWMTPVGDLSGMWPIK